MKEINITSTKDVKQAIDILEKYKTAIKMASNDFFLLAESYIKAKMDDIYASKGGQYPIYEEDTDTLINSIGSNFIATKVTVKGMTTLVLKSQNKELTFLEFGAGTLGQREQHPSINGLSETPNVTVHKNDWQYNVNSPYKFVNKAGIGWYHTPPKKGFEVGKRRFYGWQAYSFAYEALQLYYASGRALSDYKKSITKHLKGVKI